MRRSRSELDARIAEHRWALGVLAVHAVARSAHPVWRGFAIVTAAPSPPTRGAM